MKINVAGKIYDVHNLTKQQADAGVTAGRWSLVPYNTPAVQQITVGQLFAGIPDVTAPRYAPKAKAGFRAPAGLAGTSTVFDFTTGHGWSASNGAPTLAQVAGGVFRDDHLKVTTAGTGTFTAIRKTGATAVDTRTSHVVLLVMCEDVSKLGNMSLTYAGTGGLTGGNNWSWSNQIYSTSQQAGQARLRSGQWKAITIGYPQVGKAGTATDPGGANPPSAITEWQLAIGDQGTGPAVVHIGGLFLRPNAAVPDFPGGVITICADDSYISHRNILQPLTAARGNMPVTLFPIISQVGASASYCSVADLQFLQSQGWEVGAHAFDTVAHSSALNSWTPQQIREDYLKSKAWIKHNGLGGATSYAYPLGIFNYGFSDALADLVHGARTINGISQVSETLFPEDVMELRSLSGVAAPGGPSSPINVQTFPSASFTTLLDQIAAYGQWGIFTLHDIAPTGSGANTAATAQVAAFLDAIQAKGIPVRTMGHVLSRIRRAAL